MSRQPTQFDAVTALASKKGSWEMANVKEEAHPAPLYLPIPPNRGIGDEGGTFLPVLPLVSSSNSTPPKSTVRLLPSSGFSTCVDTASNFPMTLILPGIPHISIPVEGREKREPPNRSHQYQNPRKKVRFPCDDCGTEYAQRQGLNRHHREKHKPNLCMYCDAEWGRPYEYRDHLEKHHPDVDRDMVIGKATGSRRRSACFARNRSQQVSLPIIEHGRGHSRITRYPYVPQTLFHP